MKKLEFEALIKEMVDQQTKEQFNKLKAQLKETEQALDKVLDIAEDRGLSTALYLKFVTEKNLKDEFEQFLIEYNNKQNKELVH